MIKGCKLIYRVYWLYSTSQDRGAHPHKKLKQSIFCIQGSVDFILDNGKDRNTITLDSRGEGLIINEPIWREVTNFKNDPSILILASDFYNEKDYIRSYKEFRKWKLNS